MRKFANCYGNAIAFCTLFYGYTTYPQINHPRHPRPIIFWSYRPRDALPGYAYGLMSANNSSKNAIIGLLYFTRTWILETNATMSTNSINIMNIHYSWYSQQRRTQSYNENIADQNLSIFHHFNVRSPRSDPINYWLTYYQIADLTL